MTVELLAIAGTAQYCDLTQSQLPCNARPAREDRLTPVFPR
jgi:hypothetical protein